MDADSIVNAWFDKKRTQIDPNKASTSDMSADAIVDGYFAKKSGKSPNPLDDTAVTNAISNVGSQEYNDLCERFAETQVLGTHGLYPDAATAWNNYVSQGKAYSGDKAPSGALVYFKPDSSNGGNGHVGISDGNGNIVAATSNGVKFTPISSWTKQTGQSMLGYAIPK